MKKIIFHGGCLSCDKQKKHGVAYCKGCCYFEADWTLPNLKEDNVEREKQWAQRKVKIVSKILHFLFNL